MSLKEIYVSIDESLELVLDRLHKEERIVKYVGMFLGDNSFNDLEKAFDERNAANAFRAAHTLKGVASNLGFNKLTKASSDLTEDLRELSFTENSIGLFDNVKTNYEQVIQAIKAQLA